MPPLQIGEEPIGLDDEGHLLDFEQWSPEVARRLAEREGLGELTDAHFQVLHIIRDYYRKFKVAPMLHLLASQCGMTYRELHDLFHKQPGKRAAKLAGLSKATGCV